MTTIINGIPVTIDHTFKRVFVSRYVSVRKPIVIARANGKIASGSQKAAIKNLLKQLHV